MGSGGGIYASGKHFTEPKEVKETKAAGLPGRPSGREITLSAEEEKELEEMAIASRRKREQARKKFSYSKADISLITENAQYGKQAANRKKEISMEERKAGAAEKRPPGRNISL